VVGRGARERQAEGHVHGAAERGHLDGRHPDVVVRRDHGVEGAAQGAHEHGVGRERAGEAEPAGGRGEQLVVLASEPAAVAGVRVEGAEREARRLDPNHRRR
jgi:hypothetical protein